MLHKRFIIVEKQGSLDFETILHTKKNSSFKNSSLKDSSIASEIASHQTDFRLPDQRFSI